jgi:hypothetical protein
MSGNNSIITAEERAKLAVYACYRLILLNVQLVISSDLPIYFYTEMKTEEDHDNFKNLLTMLHDCGLTDLTVIKPYFEKTDK